MTPSPQTQQEYIITEEQVKQIGEAMARNYLQDAGISLCRLLRSRPAPSRAEQCPELSPVNTPDGVEWLCNKEAIRKEAAAQARNSTLTDVIAILNERAMIDENNQYYLWLEDAECAVESLRTPKAVNQYDICQMRGRNILHNQKEKQKEKPLTVEDDLIEKNIIQFLESP